MQCDQNVKFINGRLSKYFIWHYACQEFIQNLNFIPEVLHPLIIDSLQVLRVQNLMLTTAVYQGS